MMKLGFLNKPESSPNPERGWLNYSSHNTERRSGQEQRILTQWQHAAHISHAVADKRNLPLWSDGVCDACKDESANVKAFTIEASTFASNDDWVILL